MNRALRTVVQQKGGNITIRLNPPELGTMRIQVQIEGSAVRAQFDVSTEAVRTLLQQQISQLKESLQQHGLNVDQLQVQTTSSSNSSNEADADSTEEGRSRGRR